MKSIVLLYVVVLLNCHLMQSEGAEELEIRPYNSVWDSFLPGELLRMLDYSVAGENYPPNQTKVVTPKVPIERRSDASVESSSSIEERSHGSKRRELDFDRAYEQFVQQYFSSKLDDDEYNIKESSSSQDEGVDDEQQQKGVALYSGESELISQASDVISKQGCKRVRRNSQQCVVCENRKNGEKSETCSYSKESEPQRYVYEKLRSYRQQRDGSDVDIDSNEQKTSGRIEQGESDEEHDLTQKATMSYEHNSSSCIVQMKDKKLCYKCQVPNGEMNTKCFGIHINKRRNKNHGKRQHTLQKTQQRIYKRTISYSIEKGANGNRSQNELVENTSKDKF